MKGRFCFSSVLCCASSLLTKLEVTITWLGRFFFRNLKSILPKNFFFVKKGGLGEGKRRREEGCTVFFGPYGLAYMLLSREVGLLYLPMI